VANRLVASVASAPVDAAGVAIPVTVSAGVACAEGAAIGAEELLAQADAALYEAKRAGRNQARAAGAPRP
jgi:diguanylate cyclase (GGDEF)-like protein